MKGDVLVVEDNDDVRETLELVLELEGYTVHSARHGEEGLTVLATVPRPCVILLDLMMPVMNGWQMFQRLQDDKLVPAAAVLITSATPGKAPPGARVLPKPVNLDALLQAIEVAFAAQSGATVDSGRGG